MPNWWAVGLPALIVAMAYAQVRVDHWAAERAVVREAERATAENCTPKEN